MISVPAAPPGLSLYGALVRHIFASPEGELMAGGRVGKGRNDVRIVLVAGYELSFHQPLITSDQLIDDCPYVYH